MLPYGVSRIYFVNSLKAEINFNKAQRLILLATLLCKTTEGIKDTFRTECPHNGLTVLKVLTASVVRDSKLVKRLL